MKKLLHLQRSEQSWLENVLEMDYLHPFIHLVKSYIKG